jgi:hypothetical protein
MRKLLVASAVVLVVLAAKPAEACRGGRKCPPAVAALGWTIGIGLASAYAYGVGYNIYHDVTDADQSLDWGVGEFSANAVGAFLAGGGSIAALRDKDYRAAAMLAPFGILHTTLMMHGAWRIYDNRAELRIGPARWPANSLLWLGGTLYTTNTLIWASQLGAQHGRGYGIAEAAVNGPIAIGLGYLSYDRFSNWSGGAGLAYGGMAAISAALTIHGLRTAISPPPPAIDDNAMDLYPTIVDDGKNLAPGLGLSTTW